MCGMASWSRTISTGALIPATVIVPLVTGSDRSAYRYAATPSAATMTASTATVLMKILKPTLDRLYADFNYPDSATDPIQIVRRFTRSDDREVVGFCAAALAFGRVASVLQSIERLLAVVGDRPAAYVRTFDPIRQKRALAGLVHRWIGGPDIVALLWIVKQMLDRSGSIEGFFLEGDDPSTADITTALDS